NPVNDGKEPWSGTYEWTEGQMILLSPFIATGNGIACKTELISPPARAYGAGGGTRCPLAGALGSCRIIKGERCHGKENHFAPSPAVGCSRPFSLDHSRARRGPTSAGRRKAQSSQWPA